MFVIICDANRMLMQFPPGTSNDSESASIECCTSLYSTSKLNLQTETDFVIRNNERTASSDSTCSLPANTCAKGMPSQAATFRSSFGVDSRVSHFEMLPQVGGRLVARTNTGDASRFTSLCLTGHSQNEFVRRSTQGRTLRHRFGGVLGTVRRTQGQARRIHRSGFTKAREFSGEGSQSRPSRY